MNALRIIGEVLERTHEIAEASLLGVGIVMWTVIISCPAATPSRQEFALPLAHSQAGPYNPENTRKEHMRRYATPIFVFLLVAGCASVTGQQKQTPIQAAELQYVEASIAYEAAQNVVVAADKQHLVSVNAWRLFNNAQTTVELEAPKVRALLSQWRVSGQKPTGLDAALALFKGATDAAVAVQKGVNP